MFKLPLDFYLRHRFRLKEMLVTAFFCFVVSAAVGCATRSPEWTNGQFRLGEMQKVYVTPAVFASAGSVVAPEHSEAPPETLDKEKLRRFISTRIIAELQKKNILAVMAGAELSSEDQKHLFSPYQNMNSEWTADFPPSDSRWILVPVCDMVFSRSFGAVRVLGFGGRQSSAYLRILIFDKELKSLVYADGADGKVDRTGLVQIGTGPESALSDAISTLISTIPKARGKP